MSGAVARRYAKALFALAKESDALQPTADQLERVATIATDPNLGPVLGSPLLSAKGRRDIIQTLIRELALADLLARFLSLLADHQRLAELGAIAEHFYRLLDDEMGRARIAIRCAAPLDPRQQTDLLAVFATLTGKEIIPQVAVDPDLLGGIVVEAEGKVYDGSVRTQLYRLAKELSGAASL